jgi:hypothetical protein
MATRTPPRFVPTLTEVVHATGPAPLSPAPVAPAAPSFSEEEIAQRVLQRVDLVLDRRLREAIGSVILEQTSALGPILRERLEAVVREAVSDALVDEMQSRQRPGA